MSRKPVEYHLIDLPTGLSPGGFKSLKRHATTLARRACRPGKSSVVMSVSNGTTRAKRIRFNNNNRPALISFCYGELGRAGRGPTLVELDIAILCPLHFTKTSRATRLRIPAIPSGES